jgi:hypothetical protein
MKLELDGIVFDITLNVKGNNEHRLMLYTRTPCCLDVCYSDIVFEMSADNIVKAINANQISLKFADEYNQSIEFKYYVGQNERNVILYNDNREDNASDSIKKLKKYFELVKN